MDPVEYFDAAASAATAASVIFAFYSYKRNQDQTRYSDLRKSLVELRDGLSECRRLLGEMHLSIMGDRIADEIFNRLGPVEDYEKIKGDWSTNWGENAVVSGVYYGVVQSPIYNRLFELRKKSDIIISNYSAQFPILMYLIDQFSGFAIRTGESITNPSPLCDVFKDRKIMTDVFNIVERDTSPERRLVHFKQEVADLPAGLGTKYLKEKGWDAFNVAVEGAEKLIGILLSKNDASLRSLEKFDRSHSRKIEKVDTYSNSIAANIRLVRPLFNRSGFEEIVAISTKISTLMGASDKIRP